MPRPKDYTLATSAASDDFLLIDGTTNGTRRLSASSPAVSDLILGTSGPSVKSSLSARAPRQGLVFDGTAGATATISALGTAPFTVSAVFSAKSLAANNAIIDDPAIAGILIYVSTAGRVVVLDRVTSTTIYQTAAGVIEVNKLYHITYSRVVGLFINGVNVSGTVTDASNYTSTLYRIGWAASSDSFCTGFLSVLIYNRALSASEVVALYEAGAPAGADYNSASNTAVYSTDFSTSTGWSFGGGGSGISGGKLNLVDNDYAAAPSSTVLAIGKRYRFTVTVDSITAGNVSYYNGSAYVSFATSAGTYTIDFTASAAYSFLILKSFGGNAVCDTFAFYRTGLLLAPDAAQAGGGLTWYDTSGNAANITLPASGVSWNVPSSRYLGGNWTTSGNLTVNSYVLSDRTASANNAAVNGFSGNFGSDGTLGTLFVNVGGFPSATAANRYIFINAGDNQDARKLVLQRDGGNVLIGTTTDTGEKLQVNGTGYFAGALIQLGNATVDALYRVSASNGKSSDFGDDTTGGFVRANNSQSLRFITAGNIVLTLDSSANATFAGSVTVSGNISSNAVFGSSSGTLYLRPNGISVASGQATIDTSGNLTVSGTGTSSVAGTLNVSGGFILNRINAKGIYTGTSDNCGFTWTGTNGEFSTDSGSLILKSAGTTALTLDASQNATFAGTGTSSFAGNLNIKGALGAHQTAALNLAYEGSSISQLVAYGADASTLGRVNIVLRKAGTGTDAVAGLSVRDFGIITQGGVAQTPASASATGAAGTIQWDASYIYICTATNTWKRVAIATW